MSFIDQGPDGFGSSKLVRNEPQTNRDIYFTVRTMKTTVRSYRRNYSHRCVALFRTKKGGPTRGNIAYMTGSFLELDGSTDGTLKTESDIRTLAKKSNLLKGLQIRDTSKGNFHVIWNYDNPLPWTKSGESFWLSQQTRLVQLFKQAGFLVDVGASMNPVQNLRNPSQLNPFNFKRRCKVSIYKTYSKTSLRRIYRSLNGTSIPNPRPMRASVKLRRYMRSNKTFEITLSQLAESIGTSLRTVKREVQRAIQNGDLRITARIGNNSGKTRTTQYESPLFIEQFPEVPLVSSTNNSLQIENLLRKFKHAGTTKGRRNKTIFALGLFLKAQLAKTASIGAIRAELEGGAMRCHVPAREFEKTLRNVMKSQYRFPFGRRKLETWDLIEETPKRVSKSEKSYTHFAHTIGEARKKLEQDFNICYKGVKKCPTN